MKQFRRRLVGYLVIAAAALVAVLLVLIGLGILVLPSSSPAPVSVTETNYTVLEGKTAYGSYWFGIIESGFNASFTDRLSFPGFNGYPGNLAPGGSFGVDVLLWNNDSTAHTVYSVSVAPPFIYLTSDPTLPIPVPAGADNAAFTFTLQAPNTPGASYALNLTINALNPAP